MFDKINILTILRNRNDQNSQNKCKQIEPLLSSNNRTTYPHHELVFKTLETINSYFVIICCKMFKILKLVFCNLLIHNFYKKNEKKKECKNKIPLPGIEPGSPGWKPDILTAGRQRILLFSPLSKNTNEVFIWDKWMSFLVVKRLRKQCINKEIMKSCMYWIALRV